MNANIYDGAAAVGQLVHLEEHRLAELDRMTVEAGHAVCDFSGLRLAVARGKTAHNLLLQAAAHETEFRLWLAAFVAPGEPMPPSRGPV